MSAVDPAPNAVSLCRRRGLHQRRLLCVGIPLGKSVNMAACAGVDFIEGDTIAENFGLGSTALSLEGIERA